MNDLRPIAGPGARIDLAHEQDFMLGGLSVAPSTLEVATGGLCETLQPRVMQVLVALARGEGRVVSRDELIWGCWDGLSVSDHAINRCISQLRGLAERTAAAFEIETIPRVGYRLTAPATDVPDTARNSLETVRQPAGSPKLPMRKLHATIFAVAAISVLLAAGLWSLRGLLFARADQLKVAVMPTEILSSDDEVGYFAQAINDKIGGFLADSDIRAERYAPGSVYALAVRASAEGDSGQLRARVQIIQSAKGTTLWALEFAGQRGMSDALQLQIAAKAADAVVFALTCLQSKAPDTDALSLCVRSAQLLRESNFPQARILLEELIERAPRFGLAHALLASSALGESIIARGERRRALIAQARNMAERALMLDPMLADAHRVLASTLPTHQWAMREAELREGMNPKGKVSTFSKSGVDAGYGRLLLDAGRASEAGLYIQRASTLDPLSSSKVVTAAAALEAMEKLEEAKKLLDKAVHAWPSDFAVRLYQRYFALIYGSYDEAIAVLKDSTDLFPLSPTAQDALFLFVEARTGGDASKLTEAAHALSEAAGAGLIDRRLAIPALSTLGALDEAFTLADLQFKDEFAETTQLFTPATAQMRKDTRFMALAERVGLAEYWSTSGRWPDFCSAEDLGYDCTERARELLARN